MYADRIASRVRAATETSVQRWIMMSSACTTTTTTTTLLLLLLLMVTEAYHYGPPVDSVTCRSMSPVIGHNAEPKSSPPPFEIRSLTTNNCYRIGEPITGT